MKKYLIISALLFVFILSSCGGIFTEDTDENKGLSGDTPPNVSIEMNGKKYETKLGAYCWGPDSDGKAECVDVAGPVSLLENEEPIQVKAGEQISFIMDYTPKPNKLHLSQIKHEDVMEVEINDNQFTAPDKKGTYYYDYGVWWLDEEDENLSYGDAFYAFVLEVK